MSLHVQNLVLEVGRKCNMKCQHCLRGESENVSMSIDKAIHIIDQFDSIGTITFTGGEPTLYAPLIGSIIDYIIRAEKVVYSFYIATNGLIVNPTLLLKFAELYGYIESLDAGENFSAYDISVDQFHEVHQQQPMLKGFTFVSTRGDIPEAGIINEGRAKENNLGRRKMNHEKSFSFDEDEVEMVYLNAKGFLLPDCDYSYSTQDKMNPHNLSEVLRGEITLAQIFETYNKPCEKKNIA